MSGRNKVAKSKEETKGELIKYKTDILIKSKEFAGYQKDFAAVLLTEEEYTLEEAKAILDNFFGKEGEK